jgi:hypothetical protein
VNSPAIRHAAIQAQEAACIKAADAAGVAEGKEEIAPNTLSALEHDPQKWKPLLRIMLKPLILREFFSTR